MSNADVLSAADPSSASDMNRPFFQGQPPLLAIPIAINLGLAIKYFPYHSRKDGLAGSMRLNMNHHPTARSWLLCWLLVFIQGYSLFCAGLPYFEHSKRPLTLETTFDDPWEHIAQLVTIFLPMACSTFLVQFFVIDMIFILSGRTRWLALALCFFAGLAFMHAIAAIILSPLVFSASLTLQKYLELVLVGQGVVGFADLQCFCALVFIYRRASAQTKPKVSRMAGILGVLSVVTMLSLDTSPVWEGHEWLDWTKRLMTYNFVSGLHVPVLFILASYDPALLRIRGQEESTKATSQSADVLEMQQGESEV